MSPPSTSVAGSGTTLMWYVAEYAPPKNSESYYETSSIQWNVHQDSHKLPVTASQKQGSYREVPL
jgi:hypothetical protein